MKILCVSDQIDPLVYSTSAKERFGDIDLILCAGDLPSDYIDFIVSTLNKQTYFIFGNHNLSEFGYYHKQKRQKGPHPTWREESALDLRGSFGAIYAGFKVLKDKKLPMLKKNGKKRPLLIAGASGSIRYNNGLNQYTNLQMLLKLLAMTPRLLINKMLYGTYLDIFLTHAAPRHIHDKEDPCHKGFECFNWFIKKFQPAYLVHGHIHLYDMNTPRLTKSGETTVVNAYSHTILELENDGMNTNKTEG
ncbi:metallophosphoesterase [uncultured Treponema sp.]|uniref:metallophosphoesterase n=1 Tax=uncultured Treponema sp. TaxID=162155 RepID=UPI0025D7697B|nr:metallophosphoesterase [uncultured Treponema sp.]